MRAPQHSISRFVACREQLVTCLLLVIAGWALSQSDAEGKGSPSFTSGAGLLHRSSGSLSLHAMLAVAIPAAQDMKGRMQVHIITASCENMIDGKGMRPGDILQAANGKTVEVQYSILQIQHMINSHHVRQSGLSSPFSSQLACEVL